MTSIEDAAPRADFAGMQALASRAPGYAVAKKCLEVQAEAELRDPSLRTPTHVTLDHEAVSWYLGAVGEMEVGNLLAQLGPEWFVRHAVPIGAGTKDVDHLVIGPGGVFAINTKNHRGASIWVGDYVLRVNNENTHYLKAAESDGRDVARRLEEKVGFPLPVRSVIAALHPRSLIDRRAPETRRVDVVVASSLVGWLLAQPPVLDVGALRLIQLAAEEPETWHVDPHAADTYRVMQRFERLVEQVGRTTTPPTRPAWRTRPTQSPVPAPAPRSRSASVRQPRTTRRTTPRTVGRNRKTKAPNPADLFRLWAGAAIILVGLFLIRGYADQPCTSAVACIVPPLYLAFKPLLMIGGVIVVVGTLIGTVAMLARMLRRK